MAYDANVPADNLMISAIPGEIRQKGVEVKNIIDAHTSDTTDAHTASAITNVANGTISATTVQGAINELDTEKVNASDVVTVAVANKILKLDSNAKLPASITGNAETASSAVKLSANKTISLTGDVTASVSSDLSGNLELVTTVVDDSHNHTTLANTRVWLSTAFVAATNTQVSFNHGLTVDVTKAKAEIILRCVTANNGYEVGDIVFNPTLFYSSGYPSAAMCSLNSTLVSCSFGSNVTAYLHHKTLGTCCSPSVASGGVFELLLKITY